MKRILIKSPKEMDKFAAAVAKNLRGGEVLALTGELGAGKTAFVKGLAQALGVKAVVQSPTFLLMKCYPVGKNQEPKSKIQTLCHVDAYRVKDERELLNIGLQEHLADAGTVTAIEWADMAAGIIPADALWIKFEHGRNDTERIVTITRN